MGHQPNNRILLIEDEYSLGPAVKQLLQHFGGPETEVVLVRTYVEAEEALKHKPFDLILSDKQTDVLNTPQMIAHLLQQDPKHQDCLLIVCSGNMEALEGEQKDLSRINGFLLKPFDPKDLESYFANRKTFLEQSGIAWNKLQEHHEPTEFIYKPPSVSYSSPARRI